MRFFRIPINDPAETAGELNRFLASHRVVSVDRELVEAGGNSAWAVCVTYVGAADAVPSPPKGGRIDYREILSNEEFAVFAKLRDLRKTLAEAEGVPVYAVFTNEQLAAMVTRRAIASGAMAAIAGVGEARMKKYGEAFLSVLQQEVPGLGPAMQEEQGEAKPDQPESVHRVREYASAVLLLELKEPLQVNRSARGLGLCGFRVRPGTLRLSRRRARRYAAARRRWERRYNDGRIDERGLQAGYQAARAITAHADAAAWRRAELRRRPPRGACALL